MFLLHKQIKSVCCTNVDIDWLLSKQHAGDLSEASRWMEEARTLDTADRFVNCKSVQYMLRTNQVERAIETAGLFTRVRYGSVCGCGLWRDVV